MQIPCGAVYFRKSNPPQTDWERDYRTAHEDGLNVFRHWFMWGCIEIAPGVYDWRDYDAQMELAARHHIQTIIAEHLTCPEWLSAEHPDWAYMTQDGKSVPNLMGGSSSTGGCAFGPCLDVPEAREAAGKFLTALAQRYKGHPALMGYDIWNECNYPADICYCQHTKAAFRRWLQRKYSSLKSLADAWHRYSYTSWEQVQPPPVIGLYPEAIDWLAFRKENFYEQMQWRIDTIRQADPSAYITAHGCSFTISSKTAQCGYDDWLAASKVQSYGFTWIAGRRGSEVWKQLHAVDVVRAAAHGKPFWHAEMQGGPLWLQPQCPGRPREDGRIPRPSDIRLWYFVSLMGGTRGFLNPRMRPLLDGPLFGAFGAYGMDGERTPNSDMASRMTRWLNDPAQAKLLAARPIQGEIGILVVPEVAIGSHLLWSKPEDDPYEKMMWGAYKAFFDCNIQADWVHLDDIATYDLLYLPYPMMLQDETIVQLREWVHAGGMLICEGLPGYFGEGATVRARQPGHGLDELFGARQTYVEFVPDLLTDLTMQIYGHETAGGTFLQTYETAGGEACGFLPDGRIIAVRHHFGQGNTLLIGSYPSEAYLRRGDESTRNFFASLLSLKGQTQLVSSNNPAIHTRLQRGDDGLYLWIINEAEQQQHVTLTHTLSLMQSVEVCYGTSQPSLSGQQIICTIDPQDALILHLTEASPS